MESFEPEPTRRITVPGTDANALAVPAGAQLVIRITHGTGSDGASAIRVELQPADGGEDALPLYSLSEVTAQGADRRDARSHRRQLFGAVAAVAVLAVASIAFARSGPAKHRADSPVATTYPVPTTVEAALADDCRDALGGCFTIEPYVTSAVQRG
jgi:hypothetical protein